MKVRHREENSPGHYYGPGRTSDDDVETYPGDVVDVGEETAEYLVEEAGYFEYVDDDDPDGDSDE